MAKDDPSDRADSEPQTGRPSLFEEQELDEEEELWTDDSGERPRRLVLRRTDPFPARPPAARSSPSS